MLRVVLLAALVSVCWSEAESGRYHEYGGAPLEPHVSPSYNAEIINQEKSESVNGDYDFSFETTNGIARRESGKSIGPGGPVVKEGEYSFTYPDGSQGHFRYIADENGFRVTSPNLPPVPHHALLQIEKAQRERAEGIYHDGSYDPLSDLHYLDGGHQRLQRVYDPIAYDPYRANPLNRRLRLNRVLGQNRFRHGFSSPVHYTRRFHRQRLEDRFPTPQLIRQSYPRPLGAFNRFRLGADQLGIQQSLEDQLYNSDVQLDRDHIGQTVPIRHGIIDNVSANQELTQNEAVSTNRIGFANGGVQVNRFPQVRHFNRVNGVLRPVFRDDRNRDIDYNYNLRN